MKTLKSNLLGHLLTILLALIIVVLIFDNYTDSLKNFIISIVWSYLICVTQGWGQFYINNLIEKRYNWLEHTAKRFILGTLSLVVYAIIAYLIVMLALYWIFLGIAPKQSFILTVKSAHIPVVVSSIIAFIFAAIGFLKSWKGSVVEAEKLKSEMLAYKYEALQNQINPHFLFNSFNVLSDLVYDDQKKAVFFIKKLSQLFRYVLDSKDRELVTIEHELNFVKSYAYLLHTRFEDKLLIEFDVDFNDNEYIVPMALQLLIENGVKHNEISKEKPFLLKIYRDGDQIISRNKVQPKNIGDTSKGMGLNNLKQQYTFFTNTELVVENQDSEFVVKLPIITKTNDLHINESTNN